MIFVLLLRKFLGYVRISVKGEKPERLINLLTNTKIKVWGIEKYGECLYFSLYAKDFLKLKKLHRNNLKIKIVEKHGLPFSIHKNFKFYSMAISVLFCVALISLLTKFVWNIEVIGNKNVSRNEILALCKEVGIKEGIPIKNIYSPVLRNELLQKTDKLSWISFNLEGCKLTVNAVEASKPEKLDRTPCNLIAKKDGIIVKTLIYEGNSVVKVNEAVVKGDLLASGIDNENNLFASRGFIYAETEDNFEIFEPYISEKTSVTNDVKNVYTLNLFGLKIPLYFSDISKGYNLKSVDKKIYFNGNYIPVFLTKTECKKIKKEKIIRQENELKENIEKILSERIKNSNYYEVISVEKSYKNTEKGIKLAVKIKAVEDIAERKEIKR